MNTTIQNALTNRAAWIMRQLSHAWPDTTETQFYLAGGCLSGDINDIDMFPVAGVAIVEPTGKLLSETKNARTIECKPWPVQVCKYQKESLKELVDSFDFAHIQVGAHVLLRNGHAAIMDVYCTQDFMDAKVIDSTWFTGTDYPLSSLIRLGKYYKRGTVGRSGYIRAVLDIVSAVVKRGFHGYEDFKDQLDAVDLGLLKEEIDDVSRATLEALFNLLNRHG